MEQHKKLFAFTLRPFKDVYITRSHQFCNNFFMIKAFWPNRITNGTTNIYTFFNGFLIWIDQKYQYLCLKRNSFFVPQIDEVMDLLLVISFLRSFSGLEIMDGWFINNSGSENITCKLWLLFSTRLLSSITVLTKCVPVD